MLWVLIVCVILSQKVCLLGGVQKSAKEEEEVQKAFDDEIWEDRI